MKSEEGICLMSTGAVVHPRYERNTTAALIELRVIHGVLHYGEVW